MYTNKKEKILVVDDEEFIRKLISEHLKYNGYPCLTAENGKDALKKLESEDVELVLTDVRMPFMDGIELLKQVVSEYKNIPVIMVTSVVETETAIESIRKGAYDYITKPFNLDDLLLSVKRALERKKLIIENREYQHNLELKVEEQTKEIRNIFLNAIETLAQALEAKDSYTKGHSIRVTEIALIIGKEMGLVGSYLEKLRIAGLLHDIGKIGVKETILNKPSSLTKEEYQRIMTHPNTGARILDFLIKDREIIKTIRHHHELYNGKGFPDGLKGEEIPLGARILAVADAYDAMTSTRPYRKALPFEYAYDELEKYKEVQFDPAIVDAFFKCKRDIEKIIIDEREPDTIQMNY